jgi:tRNA(Ile)-lysidine synthase
MLAHGDAVGVGVSGGADSVVLLHVLHSLGCYGLRVLHMNHQLRGAESDAEERFVCQLASRLNLPCEVCRVSHSEGSLEQWAREQRLRFFVDARKKFNLRAVAMGHNRDDQAETVLYRLLRGSGTAGLSGMRFQSEAGIVRPLLGLTREEIRSWATQNNIEWLEDSSNRNLQFARNRLRTDVIPMLASFFNPQLVHTLAETAEVAQGEEDWWRDHTEKLYSRLVKSFRLGLICSSGDLASLALAEQRRLIRRIICEVKGDLRSIDVRHVEVVRSLYNSDAGHNRVLIPGVDVLRSFAALLFARVGAFAAEKRHFKVGVQLGEEIAMPFGGGRFCLIETGRQGENCGNFGSDEASRGEVSDLDGELLLSAGAANSLMLRNWEPGDVYRRAGHKSAEKIKSLFQEFRIVLWERRHWPVLVLDKGSGADQEIVWVRRFGVADQFRATAESTQVVRLVYRADG